MSKANIDIILLAAGASSRMRGQDKLLIEIDNEPLLRRSAKALINSTARDLICILPAQNKSREQTLEDLPVTIITNADSAAGMASSIKIGMDNLAPDTDAVIIALADMPDVTTGDINQLIASYDPNQGHKICRPVSPSGIEGHPVLLGKRFFPDLLNIKGDRGAKDIIQSAQQYICRIQVSSEACAIDLDTPEDWKVWQAKNHKKNAH